MKLEIKCRWSGRLIFEHDVADNTTLATVKAALAADADLCGADLCDADLRGADLRDANLRGANLRGAYLCGKKLSGARPFFQVGPIGSRSDYLLAFTTEGSIELKAGCFNGSIEEFELKLDAEHGTNIHAQEYRAALVLIRAHAALWPAGAVETKGAA